MTEVEKITREQVKQFELPTGELVKIPEYIDKDTFGCMDGLNDNEEQDEKSEERDIETKSRERRVGCKLEVRDVPEEPKQVINMDELKDNGKVIPLEKYTGGPATEEHLQLIFDFYSEAGKNGVDKTAKVDKIPDWASTIFDAVDKDKLIETSNLASYLLSRGFTEHSMSYIASKLHGMTTIEDMREYLNEEKDFIEGEFDVLAREKSWRQDLLKWGLVSAEKVKEFDELDKVKEKKAKDQEDAAKAKETEAET